MCRRATPGGRRVGTEFERNKAGGSRYYLNPLTPTCYGCPVGAGGWDGRPLEKHTDTPIGVGPPMRPCA
jgi:hypothetical protein